MTALLAPGATVEQVNTSLEGTSARIVSMVPASPFVSLVVPATASREDAEALAVTIAATDGFQYAYPVYEVQGALPEVPEPVGHRSAPQGGDLPQHLQLTRMPDAWNAIELAMDNVSPVTVIVPDHYFVSTPHAQISAQQFPFGTDHLDDILSPLGNLGFVHTGILGANPDAVAWRYAIANTVSSAAPVFHLTTSGSVGNIFDSAFVSPFAFSESFDDLLQAVEDLAGNPNGSDPAALAELQEIWQDATPAVQQMIGNTLIVGSSQLDGSE